MVTGLLEEVEQILSGDILEEQQEEGWSLEGAVEGDDVRMGTKRLMDLDLGRE